MKLSASSVALLMTAVSFANPTARQFSAFVKAEGQAFTLDGIPYTAVGANAYWVGLTGLTTEEMNIAFRDIAAVGGTTVRTSGFNEVTTASGNYYQLWNGSTPTINYGPNGLQNFDNVIAAAKANDIRLIVMLTNNWKDYGGMDVYVDQILGQGQPHDYFYTHPRVIAAYQNYVKVWIERYLDEPTIFAWELANEPRCKGSTNATSGTCTTTTITNWVKTMSAYIKSLDCNHLVGVGDEGWFNWRHTTDGSYNGSHGIDSDVNLAIDTIDFGTFHLYPYSWDEAHSPSAMRWGQTWIENHRRAQATYDKPVLMEEFGVLASQDRLATYADWYTTVVDCGLTGVLIWQAGSNLTSGPTSEDGYAIYPGTAVYDMEATYAAQLKARNALG